ncbi:MAG: sulfurtransferase TusA family protein [Desulfobulbaceae bacterium]|nr:MAG: sulfurtransferase TusA family protein [Desulfobulbaceae bacterium]
MLKTPIDGILEMRSREPTVADDLPPWCRMSGHEYLGQEKGDGFVRYCVRRGTTEKKEEESLKEDLDKAKSYEWRFGLALRGI